MSSTINVNLNSNGSWAIGDLPKSRDSTRRARVVRNILSQEIRWLNASVFGTGTKEQKIVADDNGVKNGVLEIDSGSAGRAWNSATLTLDAGQWYVLSIEVMDVSIGNGVDCGLGQYGGTAVIDGGSFAISGSQIVNGGTGRYAVAFRSLVGGTFIYRLGVGLSANQSQKKMTLKNFQLEKISPEFGLVPGEYVFPGYSAVFDYENINVINANARVSSTEFKSKFDAKPFSSILVIGDSRNDEKLNIGAKLDELLGSDGAAIWHARGGWETISQIGPTAVHSVRATIDKALSGDVIVRSYSTAGEEEISNYIGSFGFDTLCIADFGYNDIHSNPSKGADSALENIKFICSKAEALGMQIILSDNNPFKAHASYTAEKLAAIKVLNTSLKDLAALNGYLWVSVYAQLADSTDPDKLSDGLGTTPNYSQDGLHLNEAGSLLYATAIKSVIDANR